MVSMLLGRRRGTGCHGHHWDRLTAGSKERPGGGRRLYARNRGLYKYARLVSCMIRLAVGECLLRIVGQMITKRTGKQIDLLFNVQLADNILNIQ